MTPSFYTGCLILKSDSSLRVAFSYKDHTILSSKRDEGKGENTKEYTASAG